MATLELRRGVSEVEIEAEDHGDGKVVITADGVPVLEFTTKGFLRRLRGLPRTLGFRLLDDGRIAIPKKKVR